MSNFHQLCISFIKLLIFCQVSVSAKKFIKGRFLALKHMKLYKTKYEFEKELVLFSDMFTEILSLLTVFGQKSLLNCLGTSINVYVKLLLVLFSGK